MEGVERVEWSSVRRQPALEAGERDTLSFSLASISGPLP